MTGTFPTIGTGIDAVLDALDFSFDFGAGTFVIKLNGSNTIVNFDPNISTAGISIGSGGSAGAPCSSGWCVTVTGTVTANGVAVQIPATTVSGLPDASVPTSSNPGNLQQMIQDAYGAAGTISNFSYTVTSSSATQVVARLTFNVAITSPVAMTQSYDLTYTFTKAGATSGSGSGGGTSSGAVSAPLTAASSYAIGYAGMVHASPVDQYVGLDVRTVTATLSPSGALSSYVFDVDENLSVGGASTSELGGNADLTWGRWNGGTLGGKYYAYSLTPGLTNKQGFHYVIGTTTAPRPTAGTFSYPAIAATGPTDRLGSAAAGSVTLASSAAAVNYATGKVGFDITLAFGGIDYRIFSNGGTATVSSSAFSFTSGVIPANDWGVSGQTVFVNMNGAPLSSAHAFAYLIPYGTTARYLALVYFVTNGPSGIVIFDKGS